MEEEKLIKMKQKRKTGETRKWGAKISAPTLKVEEDHWLPFQQIQIKVEEDLWLPFQQLQIKVEDDL